MTRAPIVIGAIVSALGTGTVLGLTAMSPASVPAAPAVAEAETPPAPVSHGGRIDFVKGQRPIAVLPDGRRRAIASLLKVDGPLHYGEFVWNDTGVPRGRAWVRIDLDAQLLSVFRGDHEVGTAVVLYGADEKPTPTGSFPILAKLRDHVSSLYDAPMPYTMRLTGDGVAIHGSNVRRGAATHGCIGVPTEFAAKLFGEVRLGDEVVIVRGGKRSARATS